MGVGRVGVPPVRRWYGPAVSLRARRQALIERHDLRGDEFCRAYARAADEWLSDLFDQATGGDGQGMALMAVGGYGRGELCPFSDLDVVLVHKGRRDVKTTADKIWYPVWDEGSPSITVCAGRPTSWPWPARTSGWPSACSTPGWCAAT